jgi:hexosaminidase
MQCTGGVASAPGKPSPGIFKDNFIHLGGDEVNTACWESTPSVKAWLDAKNMTADQGYAYFVQKTAAIAIAQGHRPVQWSEVFDHFKDKLDKKVIIHIWKSVTVRMKMSPSSVTLFCHVGDRTLCW